MPKIELIHLKKNFGRNPVLTNVNLQIDEGETLVIIGRSGCGKSVVLKHIIGLLKPDSGKVLIDGEDIAVMKEREIFRIRKKFGVLFQGGALLDSLNVWGNVGLGLSEQKRMPENEIMNVVREKLEMVGMSGTEKYMPSDLSGGMKKRVALARAIALEPEIILYDEPTTGLDPITADSINELIVFLKNKLEITSVVVTHDMASVRKVADRVAMLQNGEIIFNGTVSDIEKTKDPIVRQFVEGRSDGSINLPSVTDDEEDREFY